MDLKTIATAVAASAVTAFATVKLLAWKKHDDAKMRLSIRLSTPAEIARFAGVLATLHNTKNFELAAGGVSAETTQCLANIKFILEHVMGGGHDRSRSDSVLNRIVKVNVYLRDSDRSAYSTMNEAYQTFFKKHSTVLDDGSGMPARMTSAAVTLALGAAVEIECVAALP